VALETRNHPVRAHAVAHFLPLAFAAQVSPTRILKALIADRYDSEGALWMFKRWLGLFEKAKDGKHVERLLPSFGLHATRSELRELILSLETNLCAQELQKYQDKPDAYTIAGPNARLPYDTPAFMRRLARLAAVILRPDSILGQQHIELLCVARLGELAILACAREDVCDTERSRWIGRVLGHQEAGSTSTATRNEAATQSASAHSGETRETFSNIHCQVRILTDLMQEHLDEEIHSDGTSRWHALACLTFALAVAHRCQEVKGKRQRAVQTVLERVLKRCFDLGLKEMCLRVCQAWNNTYAISQCCSLSRQWHLALETQLEQVLARSLSRADSHRHSLKTFSEYGTVVSEEAAWLSLMDLLLPRHTGEATELECGVAPLDEVQVVSNALVPGQDAAVDVESERHTYRLDDREATEAKGAVFHTIREAVRGGGSVNEMSSCMSCALSYFVERRLPLRFFEEAILQVLDSCAACPPYTEAIVDWYDTVRASTPAHWSASFRVQMTQVKMDNLDGAG